MAQPRRMTAVAALQWIENELDEEFSEEDLDLDQESDEEYDDSRSYLTLPLFLVGHDVGYYGPPFFPVGSNFCASVYVHSCISGDVSQPSASLPSSTSFAIYHAFCDYTL